MKRLLPAILTTLALCALTFPATAGDSTTLPCSILGADGRVLPPSPTGLYTCSTEQPVTAPSAADDINLVQIGSTVGPLYNSMSGGDSDGDNLFEAYFYIGLGGTFTYRIYENNGSNVYNQVFQATQGLIPYTYGDTDGDGLKEVIGQWSNWLYVWESPAAGQLATSMVWQSPSLMNITGYTTSGDLDGDGLGEIIHTRNAWGTDNLLMIYEATGNNQYQLIFSQWVSDYNLGWKALGDFDGDGHNEVAFSSGGGDVHVFESTGNNVLQQTFTQNMGTFNAYACVAAHDMDGNGRDEFIVGGSDSGPGWVTRIYEATGNNAYTVRQEIIINDNYFGTPGNAAGDFDNDGRDELIIQTAQALHVYEWNGQQYVEVQTIPENFGSILHGVFAFDTNNNDFDDLFWVGIDYDEASVILENEVTGPPPDVTIALQYQGMGAGSFSYQATLTNNETVPVGFEAWIMTRMPNGSWIGPQLGPLTMTLPGGASVTRPRTQMVPGSAPAGEYLYYGYVGDYPAAKWDSSGFPFTISGTDDRTAGLADWRCTGEPFPGESSQEAVELPLANRFTRAPANSETFIPSIPCSDETIAFTLPESSHVTITVYDVVGREVATLVDGSLGAGSHQVDVRRLNLPAGMYLYRLTAGGQAATGKLMILK
ncbi:MAG: T9SS C-terminal target domain-containing protein [Candidatus Zixiibacteriota bacterium]|nr:MAG: T9SS C-terminal target domain-containing protein [candidate division Zixibacteria bacterium]